MNRGIDRAVCLLAGYCFTLAIAATCLMQMARAQDAVPPGPPPGYQLLRERVHLGPGVIIDTREIRNGVRQLKANGVEAACQGDCVETATAHCVADHPVCDGSVDPAAAEFLERATKALVAEFGNGMTFRVTMPYPGQFFEKACSGPTCCEQMLSHLGGGVTFVEHPRPAITAKFIRLGCPCAAAGECTCGSQNSCGAECAAAACAADNASCKCCPCAGEVAVAHEAKCGEECCEVADRDFLIRHVRHLDQLPEHDPIKLMHCIAGLVGEKAAAQAALAVRKEADDQIGELFESMAELYADNAALDAKLEAATEQRKLIEKMAELAVENARLKTHIELAAARAEADKSAAVLAVQNEQLKHRLADLEHKQALAEASPPTYSRVVSKQADGTVEIQEESVGTAALPHAERKHR